MNNCETNALALTVANLRVRTKSSRCLDSRPGSSWLQWWLRLPGSRSGQAGKRDNPASLPHFACSSAFAQPVPEVYRSVTQT